MEVSSEECLRSTANIVKHTGQPEDGPGQLAEQREVVEEVGHRRKRGQIVDHGGRVKVQPRELKPPKLQKTSKISTKTFPETRNPVSARASCFSKTGPNSWRTSGTSNFSTSGSA